MASAPAEEEAARGRRERRRQLDARRSKCRIRLGGRMERWCRLKERLGFALHSQLATFLLDRYLSSGCTFCSGPEPLSPKSLQCLVLQCHAHSRECGLAPELRGPAGRGALLWECSAGHSFSWEPPLSPEPGGAPLRAWSSEQEPAGLQQEHDGATPEALLLGGVGPQPETFPPAREEEAEDEVLSDASPWSYSSSADGSEPDVSGPPTVPATHTPEEGKTPAAATPPAEPSPGVSLLHPGAALLPTGLPTTSEAEVQLQPKGTLQAEPIASPRSQALSTPTLAPDEDAAQIVPKRIRRATKRELLPCDFPGCGRIFSNRQYLNHHKKYQHIHQKSFCCPEPACGKSFNFKKHLKEHVKLHSDTRDYICEFCARSFRTSSNLVIHRRIHTGEKPLQCEICGFTCRQKASLNWHRRRHSETAAALRFPCRLCGKRFEKPGSVAAHCSKSHPALPASPGPTEPCAALSTSEALEAPEGSRPLPAPQAPASQVGLEPGVVVHACNPSTWEAEVGGSM